MGLLSEGTPLSWPETKSLSDHVRHHGIIQFINLYERVKDRKGDVLKWGDEVEYMLIKLDHKNKRALLSLRAHEILPELQKMEHLNPSAAKSLWRPEYADYQIEGTPGKPYGGFIAHFNVVEANMKQRREEVMELLQKDEIVLSLTSFPRLGCPVFTNPSSLPTPHEGASRSLFFPQEAIYPAHPRFATLTRNIRERRKEKVAINLPIFRDINTPSPFVEDFSLVGDNGESQSAALPDHVYMDAMGFGMGCCCLQLTFQACCIEEAKTLYDQLTPLCPILLALSAGCPVYRGFMTDVDCRWNVIAGSVDCRTREERGEVPLKHDRFRINKSRYDSIDSYLSKNTECYNDIPIVKDDAIYKQLCTAGIDHLLAQHIAHLFIRDPVSLFSEKIHLNDDEDSDHFENIQSTNWQTMRFKPPPPGSSIGWRVEFRPCEVQLTDFENAAFVCFVVLLTRVVLSFQLDFLIPISKVDINMQRAQRRDAVRSEKFWFRRDVVTSETPAVCSTQCCEGVGCTEMTVQEVICGKGNEFPGLIPLIQSYLGSIEIDVDTQCTIQQYLNFIQKKANGELMTTASWIRKFVQNHPSYKQDSVVSEEMNYDFIVMVDKIQKGEVSCLELFGDHSSRTQDNIPAAIEKFNTPN